MQSGDDCDPIVAVNQRIAIAWSRYVDFKRILTTSRLPKGLRLRLLKELDLRCGCESWKLTKHIRRKLNGTASNMLSRISGRTVAEDPRKPTLDVVMRDGTGHILRLEKHRAIRKVLLSWRRTNSDSHFGDVPNLYLGITLPCRLLMGHLSMI